MENLIVGSAGWRSQYAGNKTILTKEKVKEIVNFIEEKGYKSIDTAPSYGDSETVILDATKDLRVSSKLNAFNDINEFMYQLEKIDTRKINTLYFHDQNLIDKFNMKEINRFVEEILKIGLIPGLSIYDIEGLNKSKNYLNQKVLYQVPLNIFDLKFLKYLSKNKLDSERIIFRSLFSRGLVFLSNERIKKVFKKDLIDIKDKFESLYKLPLEKKSMETLTYSLIKYITKKGHDLIIGLDSILEIEYFTNNVDISDEDAFNWPSLIKYSETINRIEDLDL
jgi:aryl-alcohol dehydrogenase-like predicted oxidoreductase